LKGDLNELVDVACVTADDCWAEGGYGHDGSSTDSEALLNFIMHWNGKAWSQVATPNPGGSGLTHVNLILSLRCASPANCWAVGGYGRFGSVIRLVNEVLHWNGKKWSKISVFSPAKGMEFWSYLESLSCTSARNCWASGLTTTHKALVNETMHWNGAKWRKVATPSPMGSGFTQLDSISCGSPSDCWAVGSIDPGATLNQALHWNGHKWFTASLPQPGGTASGDTSELLGLRCTSASNCWAVGEDNKSGAMDQAQILRLSGGKWVQG
jgi:hypothetical protein